MSMTPMTITFLNLQNTFISKIIKSFNAGRITILLGLEEESKYSRLVFTVIYYCKWLIN